MKLLKRFLFLVIAFVLVLVLYYQLWFLRQPQRHIPNNNKVYISPANGKIVSIKKWHTDSVVVTKGDLGAINMWTRDVDTAGTMISIQMDVTNVHYQRVPTASKVVTRKYVAGNFNNAVVMSNEYGIRFENEHNEFLLQTNSGKKYKVVQIAGFLARRIVDYTHDGEDLKQGDVIGLIRLGSQVTVILPHDVEVVAKVGDTTIDGESVLAKEN